MAENNEGNTVFSEEDGYISDIDTDNELNCLVNDATDENEWRNQMTEYLWETHK